MVSNLSVDWIPTKEVYSLMDGVEAINWSGLFGLFVYLIASSMILELE